MKAGAPQNVAVELDHTYQLTHFTIAAGNDVPGRDPTVWYIEGSNDGINWTTIFEYNNPGVTPFAQRLEVLRYDASVDFPPPAFYSHFRYRVQQTNGSINHQINEIELFGTPPESVAAYNSSLGVPECSTVGDTCDSGTLLERSGNMSPPESGQPNSFGGCVDGTANTLYRSDESIERIVVSGGLHRTSTVRVDVTFYAWNDGSENTVELYQTGDGDNPNFSMDLIGILQPTRGGLQTMSAEYTLPEGSIHRVRAFIRHTPTTSGVDCAGENFYDIDDLAFAVDETQLAADVAQTAAELCPDGLDDCDMGRLYNQFISLESMDVEVVGGFWKKVFGLRSVDPLPGSCYDGNGNNVLCFDSNGIPEDQTLFDEVADLAAGSADTEHFAWGIYTYDHEYADLDGVGHQDTYERALLLHPQDVFGQSTLVVIDMDDPSCWPTESTDPWGTLPNDCKLTIEPDNLPATTNGQYKNGRFKFGGYLYYLNSQIGAYFLNTCGRTFTNEQLLELLDSNAMAELPTMHCGLTPDISNSLDLLLHQRTVDWVEITNLFAQAVWQLAGFGLGEMAEVLKVLEEAGELTAQGLRLKNLVTALQAVEGTGGAVMNGMMLHDAIIAHGACPQNDQACRRQQEGAILLSSLFLGFDVVRTGSLLNELRSLDPSIQFTEEEMTPLLKSVHNDYGAITGEPVGGGTVQSKKPLSSGTLRSHVAEDPQGKPAIEHEDNPIIDPDCN